MSKNNLLRKRGIRAVFALLLSVSLVVTMAINTKGAFADAPKYKDGTYYGTGAGFKEGGNSVSVKIENGKIIDITSTKFSDDRGFEYGGNILKFVKEQNGTKGLKDALEKKTGPAYDSVSRATYTAKGYLAAADEALIWAKKAYEEGTTQTIKEINFKVPPQRQIKSGETLDLSKVVLELTMVDGGKKEVSFSKLKENGFSSNYPEKSVVKYDFQPHESFKNVNIEFAHSSGVKKTVQLQITRNIKTAQVGRVELTFDDNSKAEVLFEKGKFISEVKRGKGQSTVLKSAKAYYEGSKEAKVKKNELWNNQYFISLDSKIDDDTYLAFSTLRINLIKTDDDFITDTDKDGVPDYIEIGPDPKNPRDINFDGIPDYKDPKTTGEFFALVDTVTGITAKIYRETFSKKVDMNAAKVDKAMKGYKLAAYDISFANDGKAVDPAKEIEIAMPLGEMKAEGLKLFHEKKDGSWEEVAFTIKDGKVNFKAKNFSIYALANADAAPNPNPGPEPKPEVKPEAGTVKPAASKSNIVAKADAKADAKSKVKISKSPNTGDGNIASTLTLIMMVSAAGAVVAMRKAIK